MASLSPPTRQTPTTITIRRAMNDHGTTTHVTETNETRHRVGYASDRLRSTLGSLPVETTMSVRMTRVGSRSNVWRPCRLAGVPPVT